MDRSAINRALAKAIAHKAAGNDALAAQWASHLLHLLEVAELVAESDVTYPQPPPPQTP
jgi:hypothetical protein